MTLKDKEFWEKAKYSQPCAKTSNESLKFTQETRRGKKKVSYLFISVLNNIYVITEGGRTIFLSSHLKCM